MPTKATQPARICYYKNVMPVDGKQDNRIWVVSIPKWEWKKRQRSLNTQGIVLRRISQADVAKMGAWVPMIISNILGATRKQPTRGSK